MTGFSGWSSFEARFGKLFRILTFAAFIPALPMLLAHGFLSKHLFPAIGLIPQSLSLLAGIMLLRYKLKSTTSSIESSLEGGQTDGVATDPTTTTPATGDAALQDQDEDEDEGHHDASTVHGKMTHPFAVFFYDIILAASIMVVLVYTWKSSSTSAGLSMLAAYATIPLMLTFISHIVLAFSALWDGLAIHGHIKWAAAKAIPADCPKCSHNLRPERPSMPWAKMLKGKRRTDDYAPLFTDGAESFNDQDAAQAADNANANNGYGVQPEAEAVRVKKDRKNKVTPRVDETSALLP